MAVHLLSWRQTVDCAQSESPPAMQAPFSSVHSPSHLQHGQSVPDCVHNPPLGVHTPHEPHQ